MFYVNTIHEKTGQILCTNTGRNKLVDNVVIQSKALTTTFRDGDVEECDNISIKMMQGSFGL